MTTGPMTTGPMTTGATTPARAVRLLAPGEVVLVPAPAPTPGPGQVRLRTLTSGISHGTELHLVRGTAPFQHLDFDPDLRRFTPSSTPQQADDGLPGTPLGYDLVGEVVEVGAGVEVPIGARVHAPVPHAEQVTVDLGCELPIGYPAQVLPAGVSPAAAACTSLAAVALFAVHDARIGLGDEVVVSGLGAIGLLAVQLARSSGAAAVIGVDPVAGRRRLARELGADVAIGPDDAATEIKRWTGRRGTAAGVDVVIETSGAPAALHQAIAAVRVAGTVVSAGFVQGGATAVRLGEEWHHNRPQLISSMGVWGTSHRDHPRWDRSRIAATVLDLIADGRLRTEPLVSHRIPIDHVADAYRLIDDDPGGVTKVLLTYPPAR